MCPGRVPQRFMHTRYCFSLTQPHSPLLQFDSVLQIWLLLQYFILSHAIQARPFECVCQSTPWRARRVCVLRCQAFHRTAFPAACRVRYICFMHFKKTTLNIKVELCRSHPLDPVFDLLFCLTKSADVYFLARAKLLAMLWWLEKE